MITTVTTATTATLSSVAATSLTLMVVLTLIAALVKREVFASLHGERAQQLARALNIAILPLLVVFAVSIGVRLADGL